MNMSYDRTNIHTFGLCQKNKNTYLSFLLIIIRRKKNCIDRLLMDYDTPEMIQKFFPGGWGGNDRDGRPIYILRVGEIDVRGIMKAVHGEEVWIRHVSKYINLL